MNNSAPSSHRTGQPRCVQLAENAMKMPSLTRRSQTALCDVTPAHGNGEGSRTVTATVLPTSKSSVLPIVTHLSGFFRKSGAMMKPTTGSPTIAVQTPTRAIDSFSKNPRRPISSGVSSNAAGDSVGFVFMANFRDPTGQRGGEEGNADEQNDPGGDQSPKEKCHSHGQARREVGWSRE